MVYASPPAMRNDDEDISIDEYTSDDDDDISIDKVTNMSSMPVFGAAAACGLFVFTHLLHLVSRTVPNSPLLAVGSSFDRVQPPLS
ncbi:hypothetical protein L6452_02307 [Arctium lappa]|uniref:Uncharacterized protein n=1 Tax=Arctium lappa TaxID=4217 RepID=A0ACB9FIQ7_ARCLA|nr:hypothetical protein L6452_02307 [Arctium lappa]